MVEVKYNSEDVCDHQGVAAIIKNSNGEILMQEHIKYGFWTIPVGKVNFGQSVEDGLKQEVFEECNIDIKKLKEIASRKYDYIRDGKNVAVEVHLFEIIEYSGTIKNKEPNKHKVQEFLSLDKIKNLPYLSDNTLLYLETIGFKREARNL
ncbi:MAG: NUDIX hydrolase [Candidatus Pacearchaeota archaeon]|jgi:8-oxo-dGTP pyrophosphatase MutT (NUDIX family)